LAYFWTDVRKQKTDVRGQMTDDGEQITEYRGQTKALIADSSWLIVIGS
jgi:hypothetical protein